jgi:phosphate transport system substrate-binding protein
MSILKKLKILCLTAVALIGVETNATNYDKKMITISGSDTCERKILEKEMEIEDKTGLMIYAKSAGSSEGVLDLVAGRADLAMTGNSLANLSARTKGADTSKLKEFEIKKIEIGFFVNPKNKVNKLTFDQIKKIYTGEITNWKEVGGDDAEILILSRGKINCTETILNETLGIKYRSKNIRDGLSARKLAKAIHYMPNAIAAFEKDSLWIKCEVPKELKTDKTLKQKLYLVTNGQPNEAAKKIIDAARELSKD